MRKYVRTRFLRGKILGTRFSDYLWRITCLHIECERSHLSSHNDVSVFYVNMQATSSSKTKKEGKMTGSVCVGHSANSVVLETLLESSNIA